MSTALTVLTAVLVASISLDNEKVIRPQAARSKLLDHVSDYEIVELQTVHPYPTHGKRMLLHSDALENVDESHPVSQHHPENGEISLVVKGQKWTVKFNKDYSFFSPDYKQRREHVGEDGSVSTVHDEWSHETHNCFYRGAVYGEDGEQITNSDVVINSCSGGFSGVIWTDKDQYMIEPARFHLTKEQLEAHRDEKIPEKPDGQLHNFHLLFNADDVQFPEWRCGVSWQDEQGYLQKHVHTESGKGRRLLDVLSEDDDHSQSSSESDSHTHGHSHSHERAHSHSDSHSHSHSHSHNHGRKLTADTQYVQLVVVNDFSRFTALGQNTETATAAIVQLITANYQRAKSFSPAMSVTLAAQITFPYRDPPVIAAVQTGTCQACAANEVGVNELLSAFDDWRLSVNYQPAGDAVHLFSGRDFEGNVLGYAHVGTMCNTGSSTGINQILSPLPAFNAAIVTHEIGHNFGMLHDSTNGNSCPQSGFIMNAAVGATPPTEFSSCSTSYYNDFMTGLTPDCTRDVPTTQWGEPVCGNGFVDPGEQCDCGLDCMSNPCCNATSCMFVAGAECNEGDTCCSGCKVRPAGITCRNSTGECDVEEKCDGVHGACPTNSYAGAGTACANAYGDGACFQGDCLSLNRQCGEAGSKMTDGPYGACSKQTYYNGGKFCGTMWCSKGSSIQCSYFKFAGPEVTVADGVPCAAGKQCLGGSCVSSAQLSSAFTWTAGPWSNCMDCSEPQSRELSCSHNENGVITLNVDTRLCPAAGQPPTTQPCQNATLGCIHSKSVFSGSVIYIPVLKKSISRNILMFSILGLIVLLFATLAGCYKAVTYGGTEAKLLKQGAKPPKKVG